MEAPDPKRTVAAIPAAPALDLTTHPAGSPHGGGSRIHAEHAGGGYARRLSESSPARRLDDRACPTCVRTTAGGPPGLPDAQAWTQALAHAVRHGEPGESRIPHTARWPSACTAWLREEGIL
jgi:hypothetical protein